MEYDFDRVVNRRNTNSEKWDLGNGKDILPMWVADMDFRTAEPVIVALERRVRHGIYGYAKIPSAYYEAEADWWEKRHHFNIKTQWIEFSTGVIPAISAVIQAFTDPGDRVLIQSPVYNYFDTSITNNRCEIVRNELKNVDGRFEIDFEDFERKVSDERVKIFILCNPHNPGGRIWGKDELRQLGEICLKYDVLVLADEIHRDLVYPGKQYIPFVSVDERLLSHSIICTSPSKTFNLAGLKTANIIAANEEFRKKINRSLNINEVAEPNVFGIEALIAAYTEGEEWLDQLLPYLQKNLNCLLFFLHEKLPGLKVTVPEATYLVWIDCRNLGIGSKELSRRLLEEGGLRVSDGRTYGEEGEGFIRINIACPTAVLIEGLNKMEKVIQSML